MNIYLQKLVISRPCTHRKQKFFKSILLIAVIMLFTTNCDRNNTASTKSGIVISVGFETSLDEAAAKFVGKKGSPFGIPMMAIELDKETRISAICYEKWCSDIRRGQKVESLPIKGSYYWHSIRIIDSSNKTNLTDKKLIPLQQNMLPGFNKVIENQGFSCNGAQTGQFHDKAVYIQPNYTGPIEYSIICKNGHNYTLLQYSDNSFKVIPCKDADCENNTKPSDTGNETTHPIKSLEEYIKEGTKLANFASRNEAKQEFLESIQQYPKEVKAHYVFGNFLYNFYGRETEGLNLAESELRIAIKLDPNFTPSYYDLGRVLNAKGLEKEAEEAFLQYKSLQKGN